MRWIALFGMLGLLSCQNGGGAGAPVQPPPPDPPGSAPVVACHIAPCHGLEITCEPGDSPMCTEEYLLGDFCRQFAACELQAGTCTLSKGSKFTSCTACVAECKGDDAFDCEAKCRAQLAGQ